MYPIDFGEAHNVVDDPRIDLKLMLSYISDYARQNQWLKSHLSKYLFNKIGELSSKRYTNLIDYCDEMLKHLSDLCISMPESEKKYRIGLVDINDCKQGKVNAAQLDRCSEVWFVDTNNNATLRDYVNARQHLQRQKICIGNKVFKHPSLAILSKHVTDICEARHPGCSVILKHVSVNTNNCKYNN
jgi:hypothetical protein